MISSSSSLRGRRAGVAVLDGVNTASYPDVYTAPDLPPGRYLVCVALVPPPEDTPVGPDGAPEICGEVGIGS